MSQVQIRVAVREDIPALVALNADVQQHHREAEPELYCVPDPVAVAAWFGDVLGTHEILIAERGTEAVGFAVFSEVRRDASTFSHARKCLLVDQIGASVRRSGVGRALLEAVHAIAAERGFSDVELEVRAVNDSAIAFYMALGYAPVKIRMRRRA